MKSNTALVLGATGGIGGEVARQLRDAGWTVRALRRNCEQQIEQRDGMVWVRGDAMSCDDVLAAAESSFRLESIYSNVFKLFSLPYRPMYRPKKQR